MGRDGKIGTRKVGNHSLRQESVRCAGKRLLGGGRAVVCAAGRVLFAGAALALVACAGDGESRAERDRRRAEGESIFAQDGAAMGGPAAPWSTWTIALGVYPPEQQGRARENLEWIRTVGGLSEARLERRSSGLVIAYGVYEGASDPVAQRDLARLRETRVDGQRPYAGAVLTPPTSEAVAGGNAAWNLARVRAARGSDALYTLQIGVYGRLENEAEPTAQEVAQFRRAAETAVRELRDDGQEAFYFHAPHRSTVTVGVFGRADFDPINLPGYRGPALERAWAAHPYNLLNGQAIRERVPGTDQTRLQASSLVRIPE